jgi:hypothetical protein
VAVSAGLGLVGPIGAATTERVVVDRNSGLAISGFDPVAYFTDAGGCGCRLAIPERRKPRRLHGRS